MKLLIAGLLALACAPALAYPIPDDTPLPPVQYDRPYKGPLKVYTRGFREMERLCGDRVWACQWFAANKLCVVIMPRIGKYVNAEGYALLRRHEVDGHCAGWGYEGPDDDHPGARYPHRRGR